MNWYKHAQKQIDESLSDLYNSSGRPPSKQEIAEFRRQVNRDDGSVTSAEFHAMASTEREALARHTSIALETQKLFFTENYNWKSDALWDLALNKSIAPETQKLFFTENYERKGKILQHLAINRSITPEAQTLLITEEYEDNGYGVLENLARNERITPEAQTLLITERYEDKDEVLRWLAQNPSFLQNLTTAQWLQIKNAARGKMRLLVLKERLKQIAGVP